MPSHRVRCEGGQAVPVAEAARPSAHASLRAAPVSLREVMTVEGLDVAAYRVPTDFPEADGTARWDATTIVVVEAHAGGVTGLGYTYGDVASAMLVDSTLRGLVVGGDALRVTAAWESMVVACRNLGRPGVASMAIAAVDTALWDLKARLLELPLATLLDAVRDQVPVYGSGGFTSYPDARLAEQLGGWAGDPARQDEGGS